MNDLHQRLVETFAVAFPKLPKDRIPTVSRETVAEWDSIAMLTLIALLEETFEITVTPEALPGLVSFEGALRFVEASAEKQ